MNVHELSQTCRLLGDSLELIDDAVVVCRQGLYLDPTGEEHDALETEIDALQCRRDHVASCMGAMASRFRQLAVPLGGHADAIAELAFEVDALLARAESAGRAMEVAERVLVLAEDVERTLRSAESPASRRRGVADAGDGLSDAPRPL